MNMSETKRGRPKRRNLQTEDANDIKATRSKSIVLKDKNGIRVDTTSETNEIEKTSTTASTSVATIATTSTTNPKAIRAKTNVQPTFITLPAASKNATLTPKESSGSTIAASSFPQEEDIEEGISTFIITAPKGRSKPRASKPIKTTAITASPGSIAADKKTPVVPMLVASTATIIATPISSTTKDNGSKRNTSTNNTESYNNPKAKRPKPNVVSLTSKESSACTTAASTATSNTSASTCSTVSEATITAEPKSNEVKTLNSSEGRLDEETLVPKFITAAPPRFSKSIMTTAITATSGFIAANKKTPVVPMPVTPTTTISTIIKSAPITSKSNTPSVTPRITDASSAVILTPITSVTTTSVMVPSTCSTPIASTPIRVTPITKLISAVPSTTQTYEFGDCGENLIDQFSQNDIIHKLSTTKRSSVPVTKPKSNETPEASNINAITPLAAEPATSVEACGLDIIEADTSIEKGSETAPNAKPEKRGIVNRKKLEMPTDESVENVASKKRRFTNQVNKAKLWSAKWEMSCDLCVDTQQREEKYRKLWTAANKEYNDMRTKLRNLYKELTTMRLLTRPQNSRKVAKAAIRNAKYASKESKALASLLLHKRKGFSKDERDIAMKLHTRSFALYNYMRNTHKMDLPHSSTVNTWRRKEKRRALELAKTNGNIDEGGNAAANLTEAREPNEDIIMAEDIQGQGVDDCEEISTKYDGQEEPEFILDDVIKENIMEHVEQDFNKHYAQEQDFISDDLIEEGFMERVNKDFERNEEDHVAATGNNEDIISESPENSVVEVYNIVEINPDDHDYF